MVKIEDFIQSQLYLDDHYRYVEEDEDSNIYCEYDRMYGSNHFKLEYKDDVDCLYILQAQLETAKNMLNVLKEFNKKITYQNIHIFLENNESCDNVIDVLLVF